MHADEAAAKAPAFSGDPLEDGDVDIVKAGRQMRCHEPRRPQHHDRRMRDQGGESFENDLVPIHRRLHRRLSARLSNLDRAVPAFHG